jgi:GTP diphosphokinase / guanosine-3',5'-bis(diphosphate) 3'-diphosphatase
LFDTAREAEDAHEFMETVKVEFYADEVFVFTPAGDIKKFPLNSTALDFAYAVHTDVGSRCTGARVNGKLVPLRYQLQSGDAVEIMTSPNQRPRRDWLEFARTGRAIQKIRRALREEERETGERLGREMLEGELKRQGWTWSRVKREGKLKEALRKRTYKDAEPLFVDIARGAIPLQAIVKELVPEGQYTAPHEAGQASVVTNIINRFRGRSESPVLITGEDGVLVSYAGCCSPLPGEPVVGFITRGRGITVHASECQQLLNLDAERRIPVEWDPDSEAKHSGEVKIYCLDRPGMLADITRVCEQNHVNINRAQAQGLTEDRAVCTLDVSVRSVGELRRLVKNIEKIRGVDQVMRG